MIDSVDIRGFQSHVSTQVSFVDGINVIVGGTDEGKSAFMQALRWGISPNASNLGFRNWNLSNTDIVSVDVAFSDGHWVSHENGKGANCFRVSTQEDALKATRGSIPAEVFEITRMDEVNFQRQKSWFMLDETPGQVAKTINDLAGIGIMDAAIKIANEDIKSVGKAAELAAQAADDGDKYVEWLGGELEAAEKDFCKIRQLSKTLSDLTEESNNIIGMLDAIYKAREEMAALSEIMAARVEIDRAVDFMFHVGELKEKEHELTEMLKEHHHTQKRIATLSAVTDAAKAFEEIKATEKAWLLNCEKADISGLDADIKELRATKSKAGLALEAMNAAIAELESATQDATKCPHCGGLL